ncbi:MAG: Crp/Fnr family transcriptional regulator [Proteobacteria bacterium]|nr:MAG: Crp/Fnr family transcriptional regulator [Pseudomonadota bacterium]
MSTLHNPIQNRLLAELELEEYHRLSPHLELVAMACGDVVYQAGGKMAYVYFPTTVTIAIEYLLEDGGTSEITSIGNEGLLGVSLFMGGLSANGRAVVQLAGHAYRLSAARLMDEFYHKGPLLRLLLRYTQVRLTQISQTALCNNHHTTEQRLCRWLLETLDRSASTEVVITQEAIAAILGVRREAITDAAGKLQNLGVIKWRRGHVTVLSRAGLDAHVCECYAVVCVATAMLLPGLATAQPKVLHPWRPRDACAIRRSGVAERRHGERRGEVPAHQEGQAVLEFI